MNVASGAFNQFACARPEGPTCPTARTHRALTRSSLVSCRGNDRGGRVVEARGAVLRFAGGRELTTATAAESLEPYPAEQVKLPSGHWQHLHGQHRRRHDECRGEPGDQDRMP